MKLHHLSFPSLVLLMIGATLHAASGDIVELGTLPNQSASIGVSINSNGVVTGYSNTLPFIWSKAQGMQQVTQIDSLIDTSDINDAGQIAGRVWWPGNDWQGFIWSPSTGQTNLGSLGGTRSEPAAVNNFGTVVGKSVTSNFVDHAFRWTAAGGMQDLGSMGDPFTSSRATDISDTDVIVGGSGPSTRAFRWTSNTGMKDLGTLGGQPSYANAISKNGTTIVGWADDSSGYERPFRWTAQAGMQDLTTLGGPQGFAAAVNDAGAVVGQADAPQASDKPVLWTTNAVQPIDLNAWLAANNPAAAALWQLDDAVGINDAGQIMGYGTYFDGEAVPPLRAFVLDVSGISGTLAPEPTLLGIAGFVVVVCFRRRGSQIAATTQRQHGRAQSH